MRNIIICIDTRYKIYDCRYPANLNRAERKECLSRNFPFCPRFANFNDTNGGTCTANGHPTAQLIDRKFQDKNKLVGQDYTIEKLKIYFGKFYGRCYGLIQHYNTLLSQFLCDLVLCWCVLHTPDLNPPDMNDYTLDSTVGGWQQQEKFTLHRHLFSHLGFSEYSCCLESNIYSRLCHDYGLMIFD